MRSKILEGVVSLIALALAVWGALYLGRLAHENVFIQEAVRQFGYFGIFVVAVLSGFNLAVPIPAISFLPLFLESGLNVVIAVAIITLGMTVADSIAYMIGRAGRGFVNLNHPILRRLDKLRTRYYLAPVIVLGFFAALVPFPNEILVFPLGFLGYRLRILLLPLLLGNAVFNALSAVGVVSLFSWL